MKLLGLDALNGISSLLGWEGRVGHIIHAASQEASQDAGKLGKVPGR